MVVALCTRAMNYMGVGKAASSRLVVLRWYRSGGDEAECLVPGFDVEEEECEKEKMEMKKDPVIHHGFGDTLGLLRWLFFDLGSLDASAGSALTCGACNCLLRMFPKGLAGGAVKLSCPDVAGGSG